MSKSKQVALAALESVKHPVTHTSIVDAGAVVKVAACDGLVTVGLYTPDVAADHRATMLARTEAAIRRAMAEAGEACESVRVEFVDKKGDEVRGPSSTARHVVGAGETSGSGSGGPKLPQGDVQALPGVRHAIAVGAGKGGVGKSTVAVNLAVGLARRGYAVGLLDGDIYGPSLPTMLGLESMRVNLMGHMIQPFVVEGVKAMTIGKLVDPEKPLIWRGPMAHGAFKQLVEQTEWGELDYLVVDLPPGTGDVSLTMAQTLKLTGAVVVCTPQKVAQDDAVRAIRMFQQLGVDVLGVVENMSHFVGDDGKEYDLFGRGGAEKMAARMGVGFLGAIPITMALRANSDSGEPGKNFEDRSESGRRLNEGLEKMVSGVEATVGLASARQGSGRPTLTIS